MPKRELFKFMIGLAVLSFVFVLLEHAPARAQDSNSEAFPDNFPNEQEIVINNCPFLKLSGFSVRNNEASPPGVTTSLSWQNVSKVPIIAFDVGFETYDPFNNKLDEPGDWLITGHNSGDWTPLGPNASSSDGLLSPSTEPVFVSFVFVKAVRLTDGSVWQADLNGISSQISSALPQLHPAQSN